MNVKKQARVQLTKDRKHEEQLHENMVSRAQTGTQTGGHPEAIAEQARETLAEHRQHQKQTEQSRLERAEEEINLKG